MHNSQASKAKTFKDLHLRDGVFVMPNAWNAGSAYILTEADFAAIGTTSAGIAFSLALPDYEGRLSREAALEETRRIADAVDVPVSVDAENGYGHEPEIVADTIRACAEAGAVGASIEDYTGDAKKGLYDRSLAVERIRAASEAAKELDIPFTLTARAECYFMDDPEPFAESVARANLYREAGADCLYVPGVNDADTIAALVREVDGPLNVVMGLGAAPSTPITVAQLEDLGVKRISLGGSLMRATFGLLQRAAEEIRDQGTFSFAGQQIPDETLCQLFSK